MGDRVTVYGPAAPANNAQHPIPSLLVHALTGHTASILRVSVNQAGTYCLTGGKDRSIRLWNPHNGTHIRTYQGHGHDVRALAISGDNSKFLSGGGDKQLYLWDVASGNIIRRFKGHDAAVNDVKYGADEQVAVSASYDQSIRFWDLRSRNINAIQVVKAFQDSVTALSVTPNPYIFGSSVDGTVRKLDLRAGTIVTDDLFVPITSLDTAADGSFYVAACTDSCVRLLDKGSGAVLAAYRGHQHGAYQLDCALMCAEAVVVAGSEDGRVCYWDMVSQNLVQDVKAHKSIVSSLAVIPNDGGLLTASADGVLKCWKVPEAP